jgi:hypothetical protein
MGPTGPLPLPAGQSLGYFRNSFHTCVKGGRWSRLVMPKVGGARKLGRLATLAGQPV